MQHERDDELPALAEPAEATDVVRRERDLAAPVEDAWSLIGDADGLSTWLADEVDLVVAPGEEGTVRDRGGEERPVYVDEVEEGRRLSLRWVSSDGELAVVDITLDPIQNGTRFTVTEVPLRVVAVPSTVPASWSLDGGEGPAGGVAPQAMALAWR